jgi:glycosyltransferase involved in cell wall biosynthesis
VRIALATDAWTPQINGVVTTLGATAAQLSALGHEVRLIHPQGLRSMPCPSYPEIRLALAPGAHVARELAAFAPHAIHVATEGPLGMAVRRYCRARGVPFTSSYHTHYPEYLRARWPIPLSVTYAWLRRFHNAATRTFVSSPTLQAQLSARGFRSLHRWRRGVDLKRFHPEGPTHPLLKGLARPVMACVGRLAVEKNLGAFLALQAPGTKLVIGDGPHRERLQTRHPEAQFLGFRTGDELIQLLSGVDVLVFPSLTDTFGIAMIEALACGVPVAAFPVPGPIDVIEQGVSGILDADLGAAIRGTLRLSRAGCTAAARAFTWEAATAQFLEGLAPTPALWRGRVAASRSSAMIGCTAARRQPSQAGDAN